LSGFDVRSWTGFAAPRGTPPAIIDRVNRELRRILSAGEAKSRLETLGNEVRTSSPDELRTHIAREVARWTQVIREAHIPQQ
jgi:tripartite-type tricarboxylate transporter receptor subunit TctC